MGWRELFGWWSRGPALTIYEQVMRHFDANDLLLVMATDALFALLCGLLAAELFIRVLRPTRYRPEAIVVAAFVVSVFTTAQIEDQSAVFLVRLPPLWVTILCFAIRVGYGIKAQRARLAVGG
jgi:hypothetical protein